MGKHPICADLTLSFLRLAPKDVRIPLIQADAALLPFADSSFDGVIRSETTEPVECRTTVTLPGYKKSVRWGERV